LFIVTLKILCWGCMALGFVLFLIGMTNWYSIAKNRTLRTVDIIVGSCTAEMLQRLEAEEVMWLYKGVATPFAVAFLMSFIAFVLLQLT
jgi:hypothetical protein